MNYTVIVENDVSQWNDDTGKSYHFPKNYLKYLTKDTWVIYYKDVMLNTIEQQRELTSKNRKNK